MDFKKYKEKYRTRSTSRLLDDYTEVNAEFRGIIRDELRKRGKIRELNMRLRIEGRKPIKPKGKRRSFFAFNPRF